MTVTYPYPLSFLNDKMKISSVDFNVQRNDELSTAGSGDTWQAELSPPLWVATVTIMQDYNNTVKQIAAKLRKLHGAQEQFLLVDPISKYPAYDPDGSILAANVVTIASIPSNRQEVSFSGFPAGYKLTTGDKFTVIHGSNPTLYSFHEVSEDVVANGAGLTPVFGIFPHFPTTVVVGQTVTLKKPPCKVFVVPNSFTSGRASGLMTDGLSFKALQKKK